MSLVMDDLVKGITDALKARDKKTSALDTTATVKRVDRSKGIAWVHFPGGVDETPVKLTVDAKEGDTVQVRSSKGRAWITGNATAPPTDDKEAKRAGQYAGAAYKASQDAQNSADKAQKTANDAMSAADALEDDLESLAGDVDDISDLVGDGDDSGIVVKTQYYLSTSNTTQQGGQWVDSLPTYVSGRYYWTRTVTIYADGSEVEGTAKLDMQSQIAAEVNQVVNAENQHFWHDSTGAYVTRSDKNVSSDYAMKFTNQGILQTYNGKNLMSLTSSGLTFYQSDGSTPLATYSSGGVYLYAGGTVGASFTSSEARMYAGSTNYASITGTEFQLYSDSKSMFSVTNNGYLWLWKNSNHYIYTLMYPGFIGSYLNNGVIGYEINAVDTDDGTFTFGHQSIRATRSGGFTFSGAVSCPSISSSGSISGSSLSVSGSVSGGAMSGTSLSISGNATVNKLYVTTPGTASSDKANCRIATGESNRIMFTGNSSREIKHAIKPVTDNFLDPHKLYDAEVVQFIYNLDYLNKNDVRYDMPVVGFIAEDLYKVYPVAVDLEHGKPHDWNERYIIPPMLALIQEQKKEIDHLTERVKILEERSA